METHELLKKANALFETGNYEEALKLYHRAAEKNSAEAMYRIGICHRDMLGVTSDECDEGKWFLKAAELGHMEAQYELAECYALGKGVPQSFEKALALCEQCAKQGDNSIFWAVGVIYETGETVYGRGSICPDLEKARICYTRGAELGEESACFHLGKFYVEGIGVEQNLPEGIKWITAAANEGHIEAQLYLGKCYEEGIGVLQDFKEAVEWYQEAAFYCIPEASYRLARCYEEGRGVPQNLETALKWYEDADDCGHPDAEEKVKILKKKLKG